MIAVCVKWVGETATVNSTTDSLHGLSAADEAAVEMALRHGESIRTTVIAVTVGDASADRGLRTALACGATTAIRIDALPGIDSASVAAALTPVVAHSTAVWCGDYSVDRGTGSVPAFLADRLQCQQAFGLVGVEFTDPLRVTRRLDGGRREILRITGPAVLSVEGSVARLRRASLRSALTAQTAEVLPYGATSPPGGTTSVVAVRPYRPRARVLPAPVGATALDRLRVLTDASTAPQAGEIVEASPAVAAQRIIEVLRNWGYIS